MKRVAFIVTMLLLSFSVTTTASAQSNIWGGSTGGGLYGTGSNSNSHYVSPYVNSRGTYVPGHHATNPNSTQFDNYGTRGNVNPYTGMYGTRSPRY
jgi:hypothetical protein